MYNWHLLLLALVAIFHPITSFTERNLVDGRQECCGRETDFVVRGSELSLYGTDRLTREISPFRRVNDRGDHREDQRYELRQRSTDFSRGPTKRSLFKDGTNQRLSIISGSGARGLRFRSESITYDEYRDRHLDVERRVRDTENIRALKSEQNQRNIKSIRKNDRINVLLSRNGFSRDDNLVSRFSESYQVPRNLDSYRKEQWQVGAGELRQITATRNAHDKMRHAREETIRKDNYNDKRQHNAREQIITAGHESFFQDTIRSSMDRQPADQTYHVKQRGLLSENSVVVERNRGRQMRENFRHEPKENRDLIASSQRVMSERIGDSHDLNNNFRHSREQMQESTDRRFSDETMLFDRRYIRENRQTRRTMESQDSIRYHKNLSSKTRGDSLIRKNRVDLERSRRLVSLERDNRITYLRIRSKEHRSIHNIRTGYEPKLLRSTEVIRGLEKSRRQIEHRINMENREQDRSYSSERRSVQNIRGEIEPKLHQSNELIMQREESRSLIENRNKMEIREPAKAQGRSLERRGLHNIRVETELKWGRSNEVIQGLGESHRQIEYRYKMENGQRDKPRGRSLERHIIHNLRGESELEWHRSNVNQGGDESRRQIEYRNNIENREQVKHRARSSERHSANNFGGKIQLKLSRSNEVIQGRDESRRQIEYRNKMENGERDQTRARFSERRSIHNIRGETEPKFHESIEVTRKRDEYRQKKEMTFERDVTDTRSRNVRITGHRELVLNKFDTKKDDTTTNWQYILYTLQAVYLFGLLMQLLKPNYSKKSSLINVNWGPLSCQKLIKAD